MFQCFIQPKQEGWERLIHGMRQVNESSSPKPDITLDTDSPNQEQVFDD